MSQQQHRTLEKEVCKNKWSSSDRSFKKKKKKGKKEASFLSAHVQVRKHTLRTRTKVSECLFLKSKIAHESLALCMYFRLK